MRRDQQHLGGGVAVVGGLAGAHQLLHAEGNHARREVEHVLELVAAHLDDHQIQRRVGVQRHLQAAQAVAVRKVGILVHVGAGIERVLDDVVLAPQLLLHQPRPALVLSHALRRVHFGDIARDVVAPGIGITENQDVFHCVHSFSCFMCRTVRSIYHTPAPVSAPASMPPLRINRISSSQSRMTRCAGSASTSCGSR